MCVISNNKGTGSQEARVYSAPKLLKVIGHNKRATVLLDPLVYITISKVE